MDDLKFVYHKFHHDINDNNDDYYLNEHFVVNVNQHVLNHYSSVE